MDIFDNENEIIAHFQNVQSSEVLLIPENDAQCDHVFAAINTPEQWKLWIDSSGKGDPPPDYYSTEHHLMMDVMRVDDHGYIGRNGRSIVNPTLERESKVMQELKEKGVFEAFPNAKPILCVDTQLPTKEDHNYCYYRDSFIRTVETHKKKISKYKLNHPEHDVIFFIFDESSPYMETTQKQEQFTVGEIVAGQPHFWFYDETFISAIAFSEIDYVVWYTPYKHCDLFRGGERFELPKAAIIRVRDNIIPTFHYNEELMESAEV